MERKIVCVFAPQILFKISRNREKICTICNIQRSSTLRLQLWCPGGNESTSREFVCNENLSILNWIIIVCSRTAKVDRKLSIFQNPSNNPANRFFQHGRELRNLRTLGFSHFPISMHTQCDLNIVPDVQSTMCFVWQPWDLESFHFEIV